jgi:hypothetical protein
MADRKSVEASTFATSSELGRPCNSGKPGMGTGSTGEYFADSIPFDFRHPPGRSMRETTACHILRLAEPHSLTRRNLVAASHSLLTAGSAGVSGRCGSDATKVLNIVPS